MHLLALLILIVLIEVMGVMPVSGFAVAVSTLFKYSLMIGLMMVISSREKREDEMIRLIRLQSFQYGLYLAVFLSILLFIWRVLGSAIPFNWSIEGLWVYPLSILSRLDSITAILLYIVFFYYYKLYQLRRDEESA